MVESDAAAMKRRKHCDHEQAGSDVRPSGAGHPCGVAFRFFAARLLKVLGGWVERSEPPAVQAPGLGGLDPGHPNVLDALLPLLACAGRAIDGARRGRLSFRPRILGAKQRIAASFPGAGERSPALHGRAHATIVLVCHFVRGGIRLRRDEMGDGARYAAQSAFRAVDVAFQRRAEADAAHGDVLAAATICRGNCTPIREKLMHSVQDVLDREPSTEGLHAAAELSYVGGVKSQAIGKSQQALDLYGSSVTYSYAYLFEPQNREISNPYDPQFRGSCDLYNAALEALLRAINKRASGPGETVSLTTQGETWDVTVDAAEHALAGRRYRAVRIRVGLSVDGLKNVFHTYGLGVPLIAVRKKAAGEDSLEKHYPPGLSLSGDGVFALLAG